MKIAIIKYNAGNVASVMYALDRIGMNYSWTDEEEEIRTADKVIFRAWARRVRRWLICGRSNWTD